MKTIDKAAEFEKLFKKIRAIQPEANMSLGVHDVPALNTLTSEGWVIEPMHVEVNNQVVVTACKDDITLFSKEVLTFEVEDE